MRLPAADCAPRPGARVRAPPLTPSQNQSRPLSDDLLDGLPPTTSTSTLRTNHTSPLTCEFRLAAAHWCTYATAWTNAKSTYQLTVTEAEKKKLTEMLETCPS